MMDKYRMKFRLKKTWIGITLFGFTSLAVPVTQAAIVDGQINSASERERVGPYWADIIKGLLWCRRG
jgi:hypothetical protein